MNPDDAVWVPTVFTKNRDRLLEGNIVEAFLQEVLKTAEQRGLLCDGCREGTAGAPMNAHARCRLHHGMEAARELQYEQV
ncbi:MAG: hypothetical protein H0W30_12265 [Gemmatimonadaceae bacterium]|nr:hypothetical protein [Gemmatimonadaceae bacterium]